MLGLRNLRAPSTSVSVRQLLPQLLPQLVLLLLLTATVPTLAQITEVVEVTVSPASAAVVETTITQYYTTTPSPTPLSTQYTDSLTFRTSLLNITNLYRYEHSAPMLFWNDSLAAYAQAYSEECIWEHSHGGPGENLARGYPNVTSAVQAWGDERTLYDFGGDQTGFTEETGHFTQLVWASTYSVGCGWTDCEGRNGVQGVYLVCEYWPPGNVVGDDNRWFRDNVFAERGGGSDGFDVLEATQGATGGTPTATGPLGPSGTAVGGAATLMLTQGGGWVWWTAGLPLVMVVVMACL